MAKKEKTGKCHICGVDGKLSYEHVPPASAFNKTSAKVYRALDVIQGNGLPWEVEGLKGKILQRGLGGYTLCIKCNSFTGAKYAKDFINACDQAINSGRAQIQRQAALARIEVLGMNPCNFAKQVLAMFASVNHASFFDAQPALRKLVLDEHAFGIDLEKYALFMYLYEGGMGRQSGISGLMRTDGTSIISTELTTMPFGFVLVLDPQREKIPPYGVEITRMLNDNRPGKVGDIFFELPIFAQNSPMPLDFRTQDEILGQMSKE